MDGSGNELIGNKPKFASIASSSALAVNTFALWAENNYLQHLKIGNHSDFNELHFEYKYSNGIGTPPNLDIALFGEFSTLAIECKFLESFSTKKSHFSDSYFLINDHRKKSLWYSLMTDIGNRTVDFKYLDAAQLIKHFFGICKDLSSENHKTLLYIYWDSKNNKISQSEAYKKHLEELNLFSSQVKGDSQLTFEYMSYQELWQQWERLINVPDRIIEQIIYLNEKYNI